MSRLIFIVFLWLLSTVSFAAKFSLPPAAPEEITAQYKLGAWDIIEFEHKMTGEKSLNVQVPSQELFIGEKPKAYIGFDCGENITSMVILNEFSELESFIEKKDDLFGYQFGQIRFGGEKPIKLKFRISNSGHSVKYLFFKIWDLKPRKKFFKYEILRIGYSLKNGQKRVVTFNTAGFEEAFRLCVQ